MPLRVAILTVSDSAARGAREDLSGAAVAEWAESAGHRVAARATVPDETGPIVAALLAWADGGEADLIVTTGGTGPALRDVTPEATAAVCEKMLPGFGELMRATSLRYVPTAILSRQ
ncbi:MAG TPA: MogA/MoaB family molybdenum cofactor biosynthesis protein, partial [Gemmatimonadales bacterium]|nr:MogA/MoaB family molybdenum cofactor biosynthesis protein [Gemmatimonadales bacterium]